jgi:hypothetical protein
MGGPLGPISLCSDGWCRKRSDKANITFECRCPVVPANIIRLTIFGDVLHYVASTSPKARGNRYEFIFGYPTPPELSGKPVVSSFLQQIFPCPYDGWCRKRSDKANITFECRCPVVPANIIRLTIFGDVLHYYVPQAQGIPHDSSLDHFPSDFINPWEIDIIKGIVDAQPNLQPMIAYNLWTKTCSNHVDNLSRCPDIVTEDAMQRYCDYC